MLVISQLREAQNSRLTVALKMIAAEARKNKPDPDRIYELATTALKGDK
jgi:hypothetical protein